jgi:hypothetical protein
VVAGATLGQNSGLQQVAGRRNAGGLSLDITFNDLANGVLPNGLEDGGLEDGGLEDGGLEDGGLEDGGLEDGGLEDGGLEDGGLEDGGNEMDVLTAAASGNGPWALRATGDAKNVTLTWQAPTVGKHGNITQVLYKVYRATGAITPSNLPQLKGTVSTTSFVDTTVQNNRLYTYLVVALFDLPGSAPDQQSGPSNQATCNYRQSAFPPNACQ